MELTLPFLSSLFGWLIGALIVRGLTLWSDRRALRAACGLPSKSLNDLPALNDFLLALVWTLTLVLSVGVVACMPIMPFGVGLALGLFGIFFGSWMIIRTYNGRPLLPWF